MNFTEDVVGVHPYADKFPMLGDDELDELTESIAANGLRTPIVITPDGLILDGRNRWEACERAGVEPSIEVYDGDDLAEYVIDCNVTRRNMKTGERAMATALVWIAAYTDAREDGRWRYGLVADEQSGSALLSTWKARLKECGVVLDFKPDLAADVVSGAVALHDAFKQAEEIRTSAEREKILKREKAKRAKAEAAAEAQRNAEIVADLTQAEAQNYLDMIEAESMTPKAAWAAYREDTRREREEAEQQRQGRSDLYSGMARGLLTVASYGKYEDIAELMSEYDADELNPPQLDRYFDIENLEAAAHFIAGLIEWRKEYVG